MNRITDQDRKAVKKIADNFLRSEKTKRTKKKREIERDYPEWFFIQIRPVKMNLMFEKFKINSSIYGNFMLGRLKNRMSKSFTIIKNGFGL